MGLDPSKPQNTVMFSFDDRRGPRRDTRFVARHPV
jgi:hypothetical protein